MIPLNDPICHGSRYDWKALKKKSLSIANAYSNCAALLEFDSDRMLRHSQKVFNCGNVLDFKRFDALEGKLKLYNGYFCKDRFCPSCNHRRYLKLLCNLSKVLIAIRERAPDSRLVFITLTLKNCSGFNLYDSVRQLHKGYDLLLKRFQRQAWFLGSYKSLEVTYSFDQKSGEPSFHPHLHIIACVDKIYFKGHYEFIDGKKKLVRDYWLSNYDLQSLWKEVNHLNYDPIVDIRLTYNHRKLSKEVTKGLTFNLDTSLDNITKIRGIDALNYAIKEDNLTHLDLHPEVIGWLSSSLVSVQLYSCSGIFRKCKADLDLDKDLEHISEFDLDPELAFVIERYCWFGSLKNYFLQEIIN